MSVFCLCCAVLCAACGTPERARDDDEPAPAADGGAADGGTVAPGVDAGADAGGDVDCAGVAPVAGLAARCCPTFGVDACGPGLFCAAFDGRVYAACHADHARLDGETCLDDRHCLSYRCNAARGVCRASPGQACTVAIGCGPGPGSGTHACANDRCQASNGGVGAPCGTKRDCASGFCVASTCTSGAESAACAGDDDCASGSCVRGACASGNDGAACADAGDCHGGHCVGGRCTSGTTGTTCRIGGDCASGVCVAGVCTEGALGDPCRTATDCRNGRRCVNPCGAGTSCSSECADGSPGSACATNADCLDGAGCARDRSGEWRCAGACSSNGSCQGGRVCSSARACIAAGTHAAGEICSSDADCASAVCASYGVAGLQCSTTSGYWAPCGSDSSCASGFWCETSSTSGGRRRCLVSEGGACRRFHDGIEIWSSTCQSAIGACRRYLPARCEGMTQSCSTDADCGNARCIVSWGCGY